MCKECNSFARWGDKCASACVRRADLVIRAQTKRWNDDTSGSWKCTVSSLCRVNEHIVIVHSSWMQVEMFFGRKQKKFQTRLLTLTLIELKISSNITPSAFFVLAKKQATSYIYRVHGDSRWWRKLCCVLWSLESLRFLTAEPLRQQHVRHIIKSTNIASLRKKIIRSSIFIVRNLIHSVKFALTLASFSIVFVWDQQALLVTVLNRNRTKILNRNSLSAWSVEHSRLDSFFCVAHSFFSVLFFNYSCEASTKTCRLSKKKTVEFTFSLGYYKQRELEHIESNKRRAKKCEASSNVNFKPT